MKLFLIIPLAFIASCCDCEEPPKFNTIIVDTVGYITHDTLTVSEYYTKAMLKKETFLKVGKVYNWCMPKDDNPFNDDFKSRVRITGIENGYIEYHHLPEYKGQPQWSYPEHWFMMFTKECN